MRNSQYLVVIGLNMDRLRVTYDVIAGDLVGLTPGAHDVGVVVGKDGNNIDTLLPELRESLDVAGNVSGGADRSESTCKTKSQMACQTN